MWQSCGVFCHWDVNSEFMLWYISGATPYYRPGCTCWILGSVPWTGYVRYSSVYLQHTTQDPIKKWIKRDQLDVTCIIISLFNAQHVSDVNTSILRSLRLICCVISWVVLLWYELRCGSAGVVWYPGAGWSSVSACIRIPHHPSQTTT